MKTPKGWKRRKNTILEMIFDKDNSPENIYVFKRESSKNWIVDNNKIGFIAKVFKTKPQALKFARNYMRSH